MRRVGTFGDSFFTPGFQTPPIGNPTPASTVGDITPQKKDPLQQSYEFGSRIPEREEDMKKPRPPDDSEALQVNWDFRNERHQLSPEELSRRRESLFRKLGTRRSEEDLATKAADQKRAFCNTNEPRLTAEALSRLQVELAQESMTTVPRSQSE